MRRLFTVGMVALLIVSNTPLTSATEVIDEQYSLSGSGDNKDKGGVIFEENIDTLRIPSFLFSYELLPSGVASVISSCTGLDDPACASADFVKYYAHMPPCKTAAEVDCIESIYAITPGSASRIEGTYKESIPASVALPYQPNSASGLPQGSTSGVWEIPNIKHGGGSSSFVAISSQVGSLKRNGTSWIVQPAGSDPLGQGDGDFRASIYPVNVASDPRYEARRLEINSQPNGVKRWATSTPGQPNHAICAIVGKGACAQRQSFPDGIKFGMVMRFSKVISGWMHGRIDSPEISYEVTSYGTRIDMQGYSTRVPILAGYASAADFSQTDLNKIPPVRNGQVVIVNSSGDRAIEQLNIWSTALKDKAAANPTQWTFYNLPEKDIASASSCIKNSKTLAGFVTTNSTTYTATPPIFNESTATLDYRVASPHYLADGKVFQGKYNLYIDSKVARCIYKFNNAPISASVSITTAEGGQQNFATTIVNEKNGWIYLSAAGFTFSSPTLKVKLTQEVSAVVATPTPSAKPSASAQAGSSTSPVVVAKKKSAITCVKGKTIKKVSAVSPKCPSGFKKKA
jgi:hypothetical protein